MTNAEIATKIEGLWACPDSAIARQSAYMAAKMKDRQFKEYLERKLKNVTDRREREISALSITDTGGRVIVETGRVCMLEEIINELFGETTTNIDREE